MPSYSAELKEQVAKKMMPPNSQTVAEISREMGISEPTLYAWKRQFQARGFVVPTKPTIADPGSRDDRNDVSDPSTA